MQTSIVEFPVTYSPKSLLTETDAAKFLSLSVDTLRVWRSKSRAGGHLIGPRWTALGDGKSRIIRYRMADLDFYAEGGVVPLDPQKKAGRPRKIKAAAAAATL